PRGRPGRHDGVSRNAVRFGELVTERPRRVVEGGPGVANFSVAPCPRCKRRPRGHGGTCAMPEMAAPAAFAHSTGPANLASHTKRCCVAPDEGPSVRALNALKHPKETRRWKS